MKAFCFFALLISVGCSIPSSGLFAQENSDPLDFDDGPYLFFDDNRTVAKWVQGGELKEQKLETGKPLKAGAWGASAFDATYLQPDPSFQLPEQISFQGVEKIAAISDIHGQYGLFVELLQQHGILDAAINWTFGKGHLVIVGDIFDRGPQVTELLWLVHKLEQQARKAGGRVHYLLGNHEVMALQGDYRYINKKYRYTTALIKLPYKSLFGADTYLGRWLRSKPVAITINDIAFVHAGFSEAYLQLGLSLEETNTRFQEQIIGQPEEAILADSVLSLLYFDDGPIWYRGYFEESFTKQKAKQILRALGQKHIVVGHTSFMALTPLHRNKVIGVDSSIKLGETGEILLYEAGRFYRGGPKGEKIKLK